MLEPADEPLDVVEATVEDVDVGLVVVARGGARTNEKEWLIRDLKNLDTSKGTELRSLYLMGLLGFENQSEYGKNLWITIAGLEDVSS